MIAAGICLLVGWLLSRRIETIGKLSLVFATGTMLTVLIVVLSGAFHFSPQYLTFPANAFTSSPALFHGLAADFGVFGEFVDVVAEGVQLHADGAGVGFVAEEEVEDEIGPEHGEIAGAIGDGAIGDVEEELEMAAVVGRRFDDAGAVEIADLEGAFEAAADVEKAEAVAAGHVFHDQTAEGGEGDDDAVEEGDLGGEALIGVAEIGRAHV